MQKQTEGFLNIFKKVYYLIIMALLCIISAYLLFHFCKIVFTKFYELRGQLHSVMELKEGIIISISGLLGLAMFLELLDVIYSSFKDKDHTIQLEKIMQIGIIACVRHLFEIDYAHMEALQAIAAGTVLLFITGAYYLYKRTPRNKEHNNH